MDIKQEPDRAQLSSPAPTKPLHIRKQPSPGRFARSQRSCDSNKTPGRFNAAKYPPRTSSLRKDSDKNMVTKDTCRVKSRVPQNDNNLSPVQSTQSTAASTGICDTTIAGSQSTARSTVSSFKEMYLSDSAEIIGNFIPVNTADMVVPSHVAGDYTNRPDASSDFRRARRVINPYEFEPGTPYVVQDARQTTISDFQDNNDAVPSPSIKALHLKNSRSEGNAMYMTRNPSPENPTQARFVGRPIHRSESSPRFTPHRYPEGRGRAHSPDPSDYYAEGEESAPPTRRGRSPSRFGRGRQYQYDDCAGLQNRQTLLNSSTNQDFCSTTDLSSQSYSHRSPCKSSSPNHDLSPSPTRNLEQASERDEYDVKISDADLLRSPVSRTPQKRSRSPMKKMFGENGWLGRSADEFQATKLSSKKSSLGRKEKNSVMGKIRNKLEELAEKADLSPSSKASRANVKHPKTSVLSVSLGAPEQARFYMEVELMLAHTANTFLMTQFTHGRMDMDTIKKTVDAWKAKGRPTVLEFMYDQATQRDLIALNQRNLCFHGERAKDNVRVSATLYNWKQVASFMAIRTFCDTDTVILKLLFDIEQILALIGARGPILRRLQQIRATSIETMRVAREEDNNSLG